jgi:hypothetical protein
MSDYLVEVAYSYCVVRISYLAKRAVSTKTQVILYTPYCLFCLALLNSFYQYFAVEKSGKT